MSNDTKGTSGNLPAPRAHSIKTLTAQSEAGALPPPANTLSSLVEHMWTCLQEVAWRAGMLIDRDEPLSPESKQTLQNIHDTANPENIYGEMVRLLADASSKEQGQVDLLRAQLAEAWAEVFRLRAEPAHRKTAELLAAAKEATLSGCPCDTCERLRKAAAAMEVRA